ncbi:MAG: LysR family transcriptional regulator [Pseudomonadota bacterium]|nr:LysR family transcriptional regulator [Pseudomonadota bacterium]
MLDKLDIKQMRLLLLVAQTQNLSRAADALDVSQQAVSIQLKALRAIFHDPLFVRHGHKMVPTPKCERLCAKIKSVLESLEPETQPERFDPAAVEQTVTVSAADYSQAALLVELFTRVRRLAPGLKLIVKDLEIDSLEESMREGKLDLVVSIPDFLPDQLPYTTLFSERYVCVAASGADVRISAFTDLNHFDHLIVSPARANLRGSSAQWFKALGVDRNIVSSVPSFNLVADYLKGTNTLAFVPSRLLPHPELQVVDVDQTPPGFDVVVAWHPRTRHSPLHRWLIGQLVDIAQQKTAAPGWTLGAATGQ